MAAVRPVGDFTDASEMLAEALKQMDGLLAGWLHAELLGLNCTRRAHTLS